MNVNDFQFPGLWRPALEIFILTMVIYGALRFVRGTRGWPVVTGFIVALLALVLVTYLLDLHVLRWLLGTFSAFLAVAVVVIFQPELRRMLAELGNLPLFATTHEQRESIEVVIQAVERLAKDRIGALLAIEQSIQLREAVESGVRVDCEATPEMLECIFFPNNATHDGGVLLKGGRITHAACIFPLTQSPELDKSLGTRHRAALGLAEETDAVVVVISEETGAVSYAYKGQLVRGVTTEELRAFLTATLIHPAKARGLVAWVRARFLETPPPGPAVVTRGNLGKTPLRPRAMIGFLRNVFIKDLGLKLFALAWAVLIWATVQFAISRGITGVPQSSPTATIFERNKTTTNRQSPPATPTPLPVQFTFSNLPVLKMSAARDVLALTVQPEHVDVTVQGEEHLIQQLTGRDIRVTVDVMGITAARGLRKRVEVITPPGITLVRVVPENVDIIVPTP